MEAKEIIDAILGYLGMTPTEFCRALGLTRADVVFDIQNGKTKSVSKRLVALIKKAYPAFNEEWLRTGNGEMLEHEMPEHVLATKIPQSVSPANTKEVMSVIQRLSLQLDSKEDIIRRLIDANDRLTRQLEGKDAVIEKLIESNQNVTFAFEKLAANYVVGDSDDSKKVAG